MKCKVYRSLDKSQSFFGLRGRFAYKFGVYMALVALVAVVAGSLFGSFAGMVMVIIGAVVDYLLVLSIQGKTTERDYALRQQAKKYPHFYYTPPGPLRKSWSGGPVSGNQK